MLCMDGELLEERNCFNCVFCEAVREIMTPSGFMCQKQIDYWFPAGIPESLVCENHKFKTGITIRQKLGEETINGLWLIQKAKGWSKEVFDEFCEKDSAWL